jgi:hypothetical protein
MFLELIYVFYLATLNATPFRLFNAYLRKVTVLHANHHIPATAALQREKN